MMADLSLHILDIADNAVAAGATRIDVTINENEKRNLLTIRVSDDGPGMTAEVLRRSIDPFFTTKAKRTGLGLALLAQAAEQCDGAMTVTSAPGRGTRIFARFNYGHIDRPPLSNMKGTLTALVFGHPEIDFRYCHRRNGRVFRFASGPVVKESGLSRGGMSALIGPVGRILETGLKRLGRT
jgi:anti-sigma regulatory factor (Ser/Thr protein kinase)